MRRLGFVVILLLAMVSVVMAGCGGGDGGGSPTPTKGATPTPAATATPKSTPTATPQQTQPSGQLGDILGNMQGVQAVQYDMNIASPGMETMTTKVWSEGAKWKSETSTQGQTYVTYIDYDAQKMCVYMPAQQAGMQMDFSMAPPNPLQQSGEIEGYDPTLLGSEVVNGQDCWAFEWTAGEVHAKWWVSKANNFPVRAEQTAPDGTSTIDYTNVKIGDIPDSEFDFPAGCGQIPGSS